MKQTWTTLLHKLQGHIGLQIKTLFQIEPTTNQMKIGESRTHSSVFHIADKSQAKITPSHGLQSKFFLHRQFIIAIHITMQGKGTQWLPQIAYDPYQYTLHL